jgi:hypothetical protein
MYSIDSVSLTNAVVVAENSGAAFMAEGPKIHAIDQVIATHRKEKSDPKVVVPLMVDALLALVEFAQGRVESHFLDIDVNSLSKSDMKKVISKLLQVYSHLHHHDRNELSAMVHIAAKR